MVTECLQEEKSRYENGLDFFWFYTVYFYQQL